MAETRGKAGGRTFGARVNEGFVPTGFRLPESISKTWRGPRVSSSQHNHFCSREIDDADGNCLFATEGELAKGEKKGRMRAETLGRICAGLNVGKGPRTLRVPLVTESKMGRGGTRYCRPGAHNSFRLAAWHRRRRKSEKRQDGRRPKNAQRGAARKPHRGNNRGRGRINLMLTGGIFCRFARVTTIGGCGGAG